jgi:quinol monooxygenase YgiN
MGRWKLQPNGERPRVTSTNRAFHIKLRADLCISIPSIACPSSDTLFFVLIRILPRSARYPHKILRFLVVTIIGVAASQLRRKTLMAKYALYAELKAKPGKEAEVEAFLKQGGEMARSETQTIHWYGFKEDKPGVFGVFDTFDDEAGREAHLNGEIAKALMAKADEYFAEKPIIHKITLIAEK